MTKVKEGGDANHMVELYNGDCIEVLKELIKEGKTVQAVICDPPYG